jgi:hypothetical protein
MHISAKGSEPQRRTQTQKTRRKGKCMCVQQGLNPGRKDKDSGMSLALEEINIMIFSSFSTK